MYFIQWILCLPLFVYKLIWCNSPVCVYIRILIKWKTSNYLDEIILPWLKAVYYARNQQAVVRSIGLPSLSQYCRRMLSFYFKMYYHSHPICVNNETWHGIILFGSTTVRGEWLTTNWKLLPESRKKFAVNETIVYCNQLRVPRTCAEADIDHLQYCFIGSGYRRVQ